MEKVNPNKILDWTIGALNCKDLHNKHGVEACNHCPLFNDHVNAKFGPLETISKGDDYESENNCNMFDKVVIPLMTANAPVKDKDQMSYDHYKSTGIYKYY